MKKLIIIAVMLFVFLVFSGCAQSGSVMSPASDSTPNITSPHTPDPAPGNTDTAPGTPDPAPGNTDTAPGTPDPAPVNTDTAPDPSAAGKRGAIPFEGGQLYAAVYLGYQTTDGLDYYAERYLDSDKLPIHYVSDGDYYLVIPRYDGMSLSLYVNNFETSLRVLRFLDPDCGPFVVQCNASDIFEDVTICLEYNGETAEFSPFISLKDGAPVIGERGLDLTVSGPAARSGAQTDLYAGE